MLIQKQNENLKVSVLSRDADLTFRKHPEVSLTEFLADAGKKLLADNVVCTCLYRDCEKMTAKLAVLEANLG